MDLGHMGREPKDGGKKEREEKRLKGENVTCCAHAVSPYEKHAT